MAATLSFALLATLFGSSVAFAAEPFGMHLRPKPRDVASIHAPVILREAPTNETCLLARRDGTLELYAVTKPASDAIDVLRSRDGGLTWAAPERAFTLPGQAYYAVQVLEAGDGALHAVTHVLGQGPGGYRGRLYEVFHTTRPAGAAAWTAPKKIVPGYIGSIRGFISLASGRLLLAVARAMPNRMTAPKAGPDFGWNDTFAYFSDDHGATWRQSLDPLSLELKTPNATRYGAIEPVLLELRDRRVWMLVRDRQGRLFQSFSVDGGEHWPALGPSPFISSDSPATLLRLRDGKILLLANACQNWSNPRSYAMGGREALHAAISGDEGRTWRGFREVLTEPVAETRGDRGTAYATAAQNTAGKVVVVSGQGEGKRAIFAFDPRWLEETEARDDLTAGPTQWTAYGAAPPGVEDGALAIPLRAEGAGGAAWNFPSAASGEITLRLRVPSGISGLRLSLTDHFSRLDDTQAAAHAVFAVSLPPAADERVVRVRWTNTTAATGEIEWTIDGQAVARAATQRPAQFGVNYLRIEPRGNPAAGRVRVLGLAMHSR